MILGWLALALLGQTPANGGTPPQARATITYEPNVLAAPDGGVARWPEAHLPVADAGVGRWEVARPQAWDGGAGWPPPVAVPPPGAESGLATEEEPRGESLFRGAVELLAEALPSGVAGGGQDVFGDVLPILAVEAGDQFGFELGAVLRLRAIDNPPLQRQDDYGGILRREDWDEKSDYGQILRELRLGADGDPFTLRAGALPRATLGRGFLVDRYQNRLNPDYHPAGAVLGVSLGAFRAEAMASDVLAPRLFAAELQADLGRLFSPRFKDRYRYHVALSAAQDFGEAGGTTAPISLLALDADAALYRGEALQAFAYAALGARMLTADFSGGAALGASLDASLGGADLGASAELRKIGGGFRFGMFGPAYELSRFSDVGLSQTGASAARLPDGYSVHASAQLAMGAYGESALSAEGAFIASGSVELFSFGRIDADAALSGRMADDRGMVTARVTAVDLTGSTPRWQGSMEARYRFAPSLYAVGEGGLVFFPQPDGTLTRGFFAGLGVGADFSH